MLVKDCMGVRVKVGTPWCMAAVSTAGDLTLPFSPHWITIPPFVPSVHVCFMMTTLFFPICIFFLPSPEFWSPILFFVTTWYQALSRRVWNMCSPHGPHLIRFSIFFSTFFFFLHYNEAFSNGSQKNKRLGRGVPLAFLFMDQLWIVLFFFSCSFFTSSMVHGDDKFIASMDTAFRPIVPAVAVTFVCPLRIRTGLSCQRLWGRSVW